ncbi:M23 family metallopeptidase [Amycolatopsis palatopharyngis]|uniref:M23 family metallopeptidase n=1 Tax=Amycolatopsis palatopharyngis TaxID=187982 RepID=UPI001FE972AF|nr:M23 family metallopeptidase [Amycolatopsis palatopharyngis]
MPATLVTTLSIIVAPASASAPAPPESTNQHSVAAEHSSAHPQITAAEVRKALAEERKQLAEEAKEKAAAEAEKARKAKEAKEAREAEEAAREAERAEKAREAKEAKEAERASSGGSSPKSATADVVRPTTGQLTSGYGPRGGSSHNGIDIANDIGTPIVSVMDGEVIDSGPASGFGLWVRVRHDSGTVTVYGHINESMVSVGEQVSAGEQIATLGNRGQSTGPHLHFEVEQGGSNTNPLTWLNNRGVSI